MWAFSPLQHFWMLGVLLACCGCRSGLPMRITNDQMQKNGIVVGSLAHVSGSTDYNVVSFSLLNSETRKEHTALTERVPFSGFRDDFTSSDKGAGVFAMVVPPGRYELREPGVSYSDGQNFHSMRAKLKHPIDVQAGEIVYIGEVFIAAEYEQRKGFAGLMTRDWDRLQIWIDDQADRDLAELRTRYPHVPWETALNKVSRWPVAMRSRSVTETPPKHRLVNHELSDDE